MKRKIGTSFWATIGALAIGSAVLTCTLSGNIAGTSEVGNPQKLCAVIIDSTTGLAVSGVPVVLIDEDYNPAKDSLQLAKNLASQQVRAGYVDTSDQNGRIEFKNFPAGRFNIVSTSLSYKYRLFVPAITMVQRDSVDLGNVYLKNPGTVLVDIDSATFVSGNQLVIQGTGIVQVVTGPGVVSVTAPTGLVSIMYVNHGGDTIAGWKTKDSVVVDAHTVVDLSTVTETVSAPTVTLSDTTVAQGAPDTVKAIGAVSNKNSALMYRYDFGNGTITSWLFAGVVTSWQTTGSYAVRAQARSMLDTTVVSGWSASRTVYVEGTTSAITYMEQLLNCTVGLPSSDSCQIRTGETFTFSIVPALPAGLIINQTTGKISGTPTAVSPSVNYIVTAVGSAGVAQDTVVIGVYTTVTAPSIAYSIQSPAYVVNYQIIPNSPNNSGSAAQYTATYLPPGLMIDKTTGVIDGTPASVISSTPSIITAINSKGISKDTIFISVTTSGNVAISQFFIESQDSIVSTIPVGVPITVCARVIDTLGGNRSDYAKRTEWRLIDTSGRNPQLRRTSGDSAEYLVSDTVQFIPTVANSTISIVAEFLDSAQQRWFADTTSFAIFSVGGGDSIPRSPWPAITYSFQSPTYTVNTPITPNYPSNSGGAATYYSVDYLPPGLTLDVYNGTISGTPTTISNPIMCTISAANLYGMSRDTLMISVTASGNVAIAALFVESQNAALRVPAGTSVTLVARVVDTLRQNRPDYAKRTEWRLIDTSGRNPQLRRTSGDSAEYLVSDTVQFIPTVANATISIVAELLDSAQQRWFADTISFAIFSAGGGDSVPRSPWPIINYSFQSPTYAANSWIEPNYPNNSDGAATYSADYLPPGLTLDVNNGTIWGAPTTVSNPRACIITASNSYGVSRDTLIITVVSNTMSSMTYASQVVTCRVGEAMSPNIPQVTGGIPDSFFVSPPLPLGLMLNVTSGYISGTPVGGAVAMLPYIVTARNGSGSIKDTVRIQIETVALNMSDSFYIPVTFYDYHSNGTNSNFEACNGTGASGIVRPYLDARQKPILNKDTLCASQVGHWFEPCNYNSSRNVFTVDPVTFKGTWSGLQNFKDYNGVIHADEWQNASGPGVMDTSLDIPNMNNVIIYDSLPFRRNADNSYTFVRNGSSYVANQNLPPPYSPATDVGGFFWLDGRGFGRVGLDDTATGTGGRHNFSFAMEFHRKFTYIGGETFSFTGDDDAWCFINGNLVLDLGGVSTAKSDSFNLDDIASSLSLIIGQEVSIDFFYAERHTPGSSISITTNLIRPR